MQTYHYPALVTLLIALVYFWMALAVAMAAIVDALGGWRFYSFSIHAARSSLPRLKGSRRASAAARHCAQSRATTHR